MTNQEFFENEINRFKWDGIHLTHEHENGKIRSWTWQVLKENSESTPRVHMRRGKNRYNISMARLILRVTTGEWTDPTKEFVQESLITRQLFVKAHKGNENG